MGNIIKLTEGDLIRLIKRVLSEEEEMTEACWKGYTKKGMKTMFGKKYPNCVKNESEEEETNEASSPAQQAAIAINMKKKGIKPKNETLHEEEDEDVFQEHMYTLDHIANHFNRNTTEEELEFMISEIEYEVESAIRAEELSDDELDELVTYADFLVDELVSEFRLNMDLNETLYKDEYGSVQSIDYNKEFINEAEYQGRKVQLGKIMQGDVKKSKVYVKNDKGKVVKVNFGFGGKSAHGKRMTIKKNNPERRKSFRARHNCENPGPRWKPRYWACRTW
jgi:hypothetical protein